MTEHPLTRYSVEGLGEVAWVYPRKDDLRGKCCVCTFHPDFTGKCRTYTATREAADKVARLWAGGIAR